MAARKRELGAVAANAGGVELAVGSVSNNDFLADVIRTAEVDAGEANVEKLGEEDALDESLNGANMDLGLRIGLDGGEAFEPENVGEGLRADDASG